MQFKIIDLVNDYQNGDISLFSLILSIIFSIILAFGISFLITAGLWYLATLCFGIPFTWLQALGIYLVKLIFTSYTQLKLVDD